MAVNHAIFLKVFLGKSDGGGVWPPQVPVKILKFFSR